MRAPSVQVVKVKHLNKLHDQVVGELPVGDHVYELQGPCIPIEVVDLGDGEIITRGEIAAKVLEEVLGALSQTAPKSKQSKPKKKKKEKK